MPVAEEGDGGGVASVRHEVDGLTRENAKLHIENRNMYHMKEENLSLTHHVRNAPPSPPPFLFW